MRIFFIGLFFMALAAVGSADEVERGWLTDKLLLSIKKICSNPLTPAKEGELTQSIKDLKNHDPAGLTPGLSTLLSLCHAKGLSCGKVQELLNELGKWGGRSPTRAITGPWTVKPLCRLPSIGDLMQKYSGSFWTRAPMC